MTRVHPTGAFHRRIPLLVALLVFLPGSGAALDGGGPCSPEEAAGAAAVDAMAPRAEGLDGWVREEVGRAWRVHPSCVEVAWPGGRGAGAPTGLPLAMEGSGAGGRWTLVVEEEGRRRRVAVQAGVWSLRPVALRSLPRGAVVTADDAGLEPVLVRDPAGLREVPLGWVVARPLPVGTVLEPPAVQPPLAVRVGEEVEVHHSGPGVRAWTRGVALRSGAAGDTVEVRVGGGVRRRVKVVDDGRVELIRPGAPGGAER